MPFKLPWWAKAWLFLMSWPAAVFASVPLHVLERPEVVIRLMATPCADLTSLAMTRQAPPETQGKWRHIESTWLMKDGTRQDFAGCWREVTRAEFPTLDEDGFLVVFNDGAYGFMPKSDFQKAKGQTGT